MKSTLLKTISLSFLLASSSLMADQTKDPIVATVNGHNILLSDVMKLKKTLPKKYQDLPAEKLQELLTKELVDLNLIDAAAADAAAKLTGEEKKVLDKAIEQSKKDVISQFFMASVIKGALTDAAIEKAHAELVKNFPPTEVRRFSHILVPDETTAKSVIKALQGGQDFAKLAKAKSTDSMTAQKGGELGFYPRTELAEHVGEDVANILYTMDVGTHNVEPIKTALGYHVFKAEEKRQEEPPTLEDPKARRAIEDKLSADAIQALLNALKTSAKIAFFDKDGKPLSTDKKAPVAKPAPAKKK